MSIQRGTYKGIDYEILNSKTSTSYALKEIGQIFGGEAFIGSKIRYKGENPNIKNYTEQHVKKVIDKYISLYTLSNIKQVPITYVFGEVVIYRGFCVHITHRPEHKNLDIYDVYEIASLSRRTIPTAWFDMIKGQRFTDNFVKIIIDFQLKLKGKQDYKAEEIEPHDWEAAKPLLDILKQKGTDIQCVLKS